MGQSVGTNLFHSFDLFNIRANESVSFQAADIIQNIFSRITGGRPSTIDGKLSSPANLYLINPFGLIFGPNAALNVNGAFHASTGHYVEFADGQRFYSSLGPGSVLSLAQPAQFGFLDQNRAPITITGSTLSADALSIVGGDVTMQSADLSSPGPVVIRGGRLVIDRGTEISSATHVDASADRIELTGGSLINGYLFGVGAGSVTLSARDSVDIVRSRIVAFGLNNPGSRSVTISTPRLTIDGGSIDVSPLGSARGADVVIDTDQFRLRGGGNIRSAPSAGTGSGGNIVIRARDLVEISGNFSNINTGTSTSGDSGRVQIETGTLRIVDGGNITAGAFLGTGAGGNIDVNATKAIEITGSPDAFSDTGIQSTTFTSARAGNITLRAPRITVADEGGRITSGTQSSGDAGQIHISTDTLTVDRFGLIDGTTSGRSTGRGGSVVVDANTVDLTYFGRISTNTAGAGAAGEVTVNARDVRVSDFGRISSEAVTGSRGDAGHITIHADRLFVEGFSRVTTESANGAGGDLTLEVQDWIEIVSSEVSTSVHGGAGGGGNILITMGNTPDVAVMILQASRLTAEAITGPGGNMRIVTDLFVPSRHGSTVISANSEVGIDGEIQIDAPDASIIGTVATLPAVFLDAAGLMREECAAQQSQGVGTLLVQGRGGVPATPAGLLPADVPFATAPRPTSATPDVAAVIGTVSDGRVALLRVTCGSARTAR